MSGRIESKIIIAHIGTTSSGKSTQTRVNQERFAHIPQVLVRNDDARRFFNTNPSVLDSPVHTLEIQEPIQYFKIHHLQESSQREGVEVIITDGSIIDPPVLLNFFNDTTGANQLFQNVENLLPVHTMFLLHDPTGVPYVHEKERQETDAQRLEIHQAYLDFLIQHDLPYTLITGNLEERTRQINENIDALCRREHIVFEAESASVT